MNFPLVSIGLPTYNRCLLLKRAVQSVQRQTYSNIEVLISDNASSDSTEEYCRELAKHDNRIHYVRQIANRGARGNFQNVFERSQGTFFMWLADDDWLDDNYIEACVDSLWSDPAVSVAVGQPKYYWADQCIFEPPPIHFTNSCPAQRVTAYFSTVGDNGLFYGVMRRDLLRQVPFRLGLGGDWLMMASMAYLGKITTVPETVLHRHATWVEMDLHQAVARVTGKNWMSPLLARFPHLFIAVTVFDDIAWRSPIYYQMKLSSRIRLAWASMLLITRRYAAPQVAGHVLAHIPSPLASFLRPGFRRFVLRG